MHVFVITRFVTFFLGYPGGGPVGARTMRARAHTHTHTNEHAKHSFYALYYLRVSGWWAGPAAAAAATARVRTHARTHARSLARSLPPHAPTHTKLNLYICSAITLMPAYLRALG